MAKGKRESAASKAKKPASAAKAAAKASTSTSAAKGKKPATAAKSSAKAKKPAAAIANKTVPAKTSGAKGPAKGKAGAKRTASLPHLNDKVLSQIVKKLDELRVESSRVVNAQMQEDLKSREGSGDVGDDMDQASNERDREFSLIIHQRHLRRLKQVEEAFERIEDGTYGLCEGTEEPIDFKRLLIMPLARFSIEYQQQQEKMLGRSPDDSFGGSEDPMISDE